MEKKSVEKRQRTAPHSRGEIQIQIQRKSKRKTKTKTQRVKQPTGGALRAPLAGSPACVFVFVFVLIYVEFEFSPPPPPHPPAPAPRRENKNHEKNEVWLKWKFRSWRWFLAKNHQNRSYPRVFSATLKFALNSPLRGIFLRSPMNCKWNELQMSPL